MAHDDDTPTDLETARMMGRPEDFRFDFPPVTQLSPADIDAMLADAMPGYRARLVRERVLAASNGATLESPMADLPRGVR